MEKKTTEDIVGEHYKLTSGVNVATNKHMRYFGIFVMKPCTYKEFMRLPHYDDYRLNLMENLGFNDWYRLW